MRFLLTGGNHVLHDKTFKSGDIIETNLMLDKIFAKANKFQRLDISPPPTEDGAAQKAALPSIDVTAAIDPNANEAGLKVVQKGNTPWYDIIDTTTGNKLNEKSLRRNQIEEFLNQYMEK